MINSLFRRLSFNPRNTDRELSGQDQMVPQPNDPLMSYYYILKKQKAERTDELDAFAEILELTLIECYDIEIMKKRYEIFLDKLKPYYEICDKRELAEVLATRVTIGYQKLVNRFKQFHMVPKDMEIILKMKKKLRSLYQLAKTNLSEVNEDSSFDSVKFIATLWRNIVDTELSLSSLTRDFTSLANQIKETLFLKSKDTPLTDQELSYLQLLTALFEKLQQTETLNQESKTIFEKREEYVRDKLVNFTKEIMEKAYRYKEENTVVTKLYKKDPQRISSLQIVITKTQELGGDTRTVLEKYNELRNTIRKERQETYQKHLEGDFNALFNFFRRKGILNSMLVEIYDKLLLTYTEMQPAEYAFYYSYEINNA